MNRRDLQHHLRWEVVIVLALSFGASAVYAIVSIVERLTREAALSDQTATLNTSMSARPGFDLTYQLLSFVFGLAPVALVVFLLWRPGRPHLGALGIGWDTGTRPHPLREASGGVLLAAVIGIPGLGFYLLARELGLNTTVVASALDAYWWTVPVLVLQALKAALGEELIVVAYLFDRLRRLGFGVWAIILTSAVLRGSYHLYQGFGGFLGNVIMGLVFGWCYHRFGRAVPLIVAHWILDIVSFVGYPLAVMWWPAFFAA